MRFAAIVNIPPPAISLSLSLSLSHSFVQQKNGPWQIKRTNVFSGVFPIHAEQKQRGHRSRRKKNSRSIYTHQKMQFNIIQINTTSIKRGVFVSARVLFHPFYISAPNPSSTFERGRIYIYHRIFHAHREKSSNTTLSRLMFVHMVYVVFNSTTYSYTYPPTMHSAFSLALSLTHTPARAHRICKQLSMN